MSSTLLLVKGSFTRVVKSLICVSAYSSAMEATSSVPQFSLSSFPAQRLNSKPSLITPRFAPDFQLDTSVTGATHEGAVEPTTLPLMALSVPALREVEEDSSALYHEWKPLQTQDVNLTLIPYFAWANRGENEMSVWLRAQ